MPWDRNDYYTFFLILFLILIAVGIAAYMLLTSNRGGFWVFPRGNATETFFSLLILHGK